MTGKNRVTIRNHLDTLRDEDIISRYIFEPNKETRGLPAQFYGFAERGVKILHDYKYLRGVPVARSLYENTRKTEKIQRHEAAPRPDLPSAVTKALEFDSQISTTSASLRVDNLPTI